MATWTTEKTLIIYHETVDEQTQEFHNPKRSLILCTDLCDKINSYICCRSCTNNNGKCNICRETKNDCSRIEHRIKFETKIVQI